METFTTIILLFAVVALGYLYWNAKKKLKTAEQMSATAIRNNNRLETLVDNETFENKRYLTRLATLEKEHTVLKNAYEVKVQTINDLKAEIAAKDEEFQVLQQNLLEEIGRKNPITPSFEEVNFTALNLNEETFTYKGDCNIDSNTIVIDAESLIEREFIKPFTKLISQKMLPPSIIELTDINEEKQKVTIWTQKFDEEGEALRSLTFTEIFSQINAKKKVLNDFLRTETESAKRLKIISEAMLSNRKEAVAS